jgi:hypothetical protein
VPAEARALLITALYDVAERSYYMPAVICEPDEVSDAEAEAGPWLSASVAFTGRFAGNLRCFVPRRLAADMLRAFLGSDSAEAAAERLLYDAAGEFVNMACGAWLTRFAGDSLFHLGSPVVESLPTAWSAAEPAHEHGSISLQVGDMPVVARLTLTGSPVSGGQEVDAA